MTRKLQYERTEVSPKSERAGNLAPKAVAMSSSGSELDDLSSCGNVALVWIELLIPAADLICPALQLCTAQSSRS